MNRSGVDEQALADGRDLVVIADLGDRGGAEELTFADKQQPMRTVDAAGEHHAGLEFIEQDLAYAAGQIDEIGDLEKKAHGFGIIV